MGWKIGPFVQEQAIDVEEQVGVHIIFLFFSCNLFYRGTVTTRSNGVGVSL